MMRGKQTILIIATAFVGILVGAMATWYMGRLEERASAKGHDDRSDPAQREGHEEHGQEQVVRLTEAQMREFNIVVGTAEPRQLQMHVRLPGQVALNADRRAHVVPRIPGVVHQVYKNLGDAVRVGEVMAVVESRELADLKSG